MRSLFDHPLSSKEDAPAIVRGVLFAGDKISKSEPEAEARWESAFHVMNIFSFSAVLAASLCNLPSVSCVKEFLKTMFHNGFFAFPFRSFPAHNRTTSSIQKKFGSNLFALLFLQRIVKRRNERGAQPLERSSATRKRKHSGVSPYSVGRTNGPAEADPYRSAPLWILGFSDLHGSCVAFFCAFVIMIIGRRFYASSRRAGEIGGQTAPAAVARQGVNKHVRKNRHHRFEIG